MSSIADPATFIDGVPHERFAAMRAEGGVTWVDEPALWRHSSAGRMLQRGSGYWAVTGYHAVVEASRRGDDFSSGRKGAFLVDPRTPADLATARELLVNMDPPRHTHIRKLATSVFTPRAVKALQHSIREHAADVVAAAMSKDSCDGVLDLAAELPLLVLSDLLGIPRQDRHLLYAWSNNLVGFDDPEYGGGDVEAYRKTFAEAFRYALGVADERRSHPTGDLISLLANAEADGRRLTDREFCQFWMLLVVAGNETTRHLLANSLQLLVGDPALQAELQRVPPAQVVEELLRVVTPIMQFRRTATRDTTLAGQRISEGDKVVLYYVSANRDEEVFDRPGRIRLDRDPNPHLSFGIGRHFCLGAHLARLEAEAFLAEITPYLPRLRPAGPVVRLASNFVNGIKSLPLRLV